MSNDLDEIKRRKLIDLQNKMQEQVEEQQKVQQEIANLESIAKQYLTKEAIARYNTIKTVHTETAIQALLILAQAAQSGQLPEKVNDEQFKELLRKIQKPKKEFKILRK
ncbi:MAG: hypothetical protein HYS32_02325 [Candidatus Woesearchaeota archaeon]|nr:MAG: hypothetical protein HYS32_02325 [Candidatus Woesearchaeota archaeon]